MGVVPDVLEPQVEGLDVAIMMSVALMSKPELAVRCTRCAEARLRAHFGEKF